ncbi:uncharacterized protein LOC62_03G003948 [Vanrija pseudolonga]|uniref:Uncharacterized protein n=1 Tax=Vanrija pseudolonga TaxID=143232 RepID=A0AAF1BL60_9TREE|nr:hypothetical protein LOC62_03G003948 [Vanrija pseudolonga]
MRSCLLAVLVLAGALLSTVLAAPAQARFASPASFFFSRPGPPRLAPPPNDDELLSASWTPNTPFRAHSVVWHGARQYVAKRGHISDPQFDLRLWTPKPDDDAEDSYAYVGPMLHAAPPGAANATTSAGPTPLTDSSIDTYTIIACSVAGGLLLVLAVALAFVYRYYHPQHLRERAPYPRTHIAQSHSIDSTHKGSVRSFLTEPMEAIVDHHDIDPGLASIDETAAPPPKVRRVLGIDGWKP